MHLYVCVCVCACVRACVCVCLFILESSAGVGDGDDGGAQSEQGGQEMGDQSGQRTQEYHTLQESKMDTHTQIHLLAYVLTISHY